MGKKSKLSYFRNETRTKKRLSSSCNSQMCVCVDANNAAIYIYIYIYILPPYAAFFVYFSFIIPLLVVLLLLFWFIIILSHLYLFILDIFNYFFSRSCVNSLVSDTVLPTLPRDM